MDPQETGQVQAEQGSRLLTAADKTKEAPGELTGAAQWSGGDEPRAEQLREGSGGE